MEEALLERTTFVWERRRCLSFKSLICGGQRVSNLTL